MPSSTDPRDALVSPCFDTTVTVVLPPISSGRSSVPSPLASLTLCTTFASLPPSPPLPRAPALVSVSGEELPVLSFIAPFTFSRLPHSRTLSPRRTFAGLGLSRALSRRKLPLTLSPLRTPAALVSRSRSPAEVEAELRRPPAGFELGRRSRRPPFWPICRPAMPPIWMRNVISCAATRSRVIRWPVRSARRVRRADLSEGIRVVEERVTFQQVISECITI